MGSANRYDGLAREVATCIRVHARLLARQRACRGTPVEELEQDLATDLIARTRQYDPGRASYPTYADRIVRNRAATLLAKASTLRAKAEQAAASLEQAVAEDGTPLVDMLGAEDALWPGSTPDLEAHVLLRTDIARFFQALPPALQVACRWLLSEDRRAAAAQLGRHRASLYEARERLRERALAAGLDQYLADGTRHSADPPGT